MNDSDGLLRDEKAPLRDAYARAGVDIAAGNEAVARYRDVTASWRHPDQLGGIGGFGGLFELPGDDTRALVASTDGVGTKILIAAAAAALRTASAPISSTTASTTSSSSTRPPLFFLDYLAVGKLDPAVAADIVGGVQSACRANDCALLGGETAEMPGLYKPGDFDLAGTIVGIVDVDDVPDPERVKPGDAILGLPAVGSAHQRLLLGARLIAASEFRAPFPAAGGDVTYADALLRRHPSYALPVRAMQAVADVKAMAHITGGGLLENVPRTLPAACKARFEQSRWSVPPIEAELVRRGNFESRRALPRFNMGIGYTLIVPVADAERALAAAPGAKVVGWIEERREGEPAVIVHPARA